MTWWLMRTRVQRAYINGLGSYQEHSGCGIMGSHLITPPALQHPPTAPTHSFLLLPFHSAREGLPYSPAPIKRPAPAALGPSLPGHTPSPSPAQRRQRRGGGPAAAHRWELVRLLVKFRAARRRQLLEAWWGTVEGAVQKAEAAARMAEVAAWRTLGQAVQVGGIAGVGCLGGCDRCLSCFVLGRA